jgi:hypothetical protein
VSEIGSRKPIGVLQGAWRREGRRAGGRRETMGERARAAIKSRGCGDLGGKRLEKRTGGALECGRRIIPARPHSSLSIHVHSASCVGTARLSRFVTACGPWPRNPGRHRPHCQRANPIGALSLDPRSAMYPTSGSRMRDERCTRQRCLPSSVLLLHLSCLSTHDARQALQAAGSARRTRGPRLRLASVTVARRAGDLAFGPAASPVLPAQTTHMMRMRTTHAQAERT